MNVSEYETEVIDVIKRTPSVKSVRFKRNEDIAYKPGQFLFVTLKDKQGREITKHFTISNSPTETGFIEFTKKLTGSHYSNTLNMLEKGDWAKIRYPYGAFTFEGEYKKIVFLSGGIGITPIRSIARYVIDKSLGTDMILLYGNRTQDDIVFRDDLEKIQKELPSFKIIHVLSEEKADSNWQGKRGLIDTDMIKDEVPDYRKRKYYICGPPGMLKAMKKMLTDNLSLKKENIKTEEFTGY
jgi:ferredoxin-NADP reductase